MKALEFTIPAREISEISSHFLLLFFPSLKLYYFTPILVAMLLYHLPSSFILFLSFFSSYPQFPIPGPDHFILIHMIISTSYI